jgi:dUTP pyrophosphatase
LSDTLSPQFVRKDQPVILRVKKLTEDAMLPRYAHAGDAGADLFANARVELEPGQRALVPTGISIELPDGTEAQVRPRSGMALKHGVTVLNAPGTIDHGYRGEVGVILINHGKDRFIVEKGMKIAQMVVKPVIYVTVEQADTLSETARGSGGFGSTGYGHRTPPVDTSRPCD